MGWLHDTGYDPAYSHEGWAASVLADGSDTSEISERVQRLVVGWRAACDCGWRSDVLYSRAEWPSVHGGPPEDVEGWETGTRCFRDWERHLHEAVPELAVHDLAHRICELQAELDAAVVRARRCGVSWVTIGRVSAVGVQPARERWET